MKIRFHPPENGEAFADLLLTVLVQASLAELTAEPETFSECSADGESRSV